MIESYEPALGMLRIGPEPERQIERVETGYTLLVPDEGMAVQGVVVFPDGWRIDVGPWLADPGSFERVALAHGMAVLHMTSGNPLDFYLTEGTLETVAGRLEEALSLHGLRDAPLALAGLSLGGTRALKMAAALIEGGFSAGSRLRAVAVVDAPLDFVRLWHAERRSAALAFHPAAADEGRWVTYLLEERLGGTPAEVPERYVAASPYVHGVAAGALSEALYRLPVRAYHEPDVNWWMEHRGKTYYEINSPDMAGLINELMLLGNERAELVTTHAAREGYPESSPHTWTLVDNEELADWLLAAFST